MKDAPAFDFYPERWLVGTAMLSDAEQLSYLRLLCHQWMMDGLPEPTATLRRLAGRGVTALVLEKFPVAQDGKRRNPRLEAIRSEQRKRIAKRRDGAAITNAKRHAQRNAINNASEVDSDTPPPTTHPVPERERGARAREDAPLDPLAAEIATIVQLYPVNGDRLAACAALAEAVRTGEDVAWIRKMVEIHAKRWHALAQQHRQFCPGLATYFSGRRWKDNPDEHPWVRADEPGQPALKKTPWDDGVK